MGDNDNQNPAHNFPQMDPFAGLNVLGVHNPILPGGLVDHPIPNDQPMGEEEEEEEEEDWDQFAANLEQEIDAANAEEEANEADGPGPDDLGDVIMGDNDNQNHAHNFPQMDPFVGLNVLGVHNPILPGGLVDHPIPNDQPMGEDFGEVINEGENQNVPVPAEFAFMEDFLGFDEQNLLLDEDLGVLPGGLDPIDQEGPGAHDEDQHVLLNFPLQQHFGVDEQGFFDPGLYDEHMAMYAALMNAHVAEEDPVVEDEEDQVALPHIANHPPNPNDIELPGLDNHIGLFGEWEADDDDGVDMINEYLDAED